MLTGDLKESNNRKALKTTRKNKSDINLNNQIGLRLEKANVLFQHFKNDKHQSVLVGREGG